MVCEIHESTTRRCSQTRGCSLGGWTLTKAHKTQGLEVLKDLVGLSGEVIDLVHSLLQAAPSPRGYGVSQSTSNLPMP